MDSNKVGGIREYASACGLEGYNSGSDDDDLIKVSRAALEAVSNMLVKRQGAMVAALKATELSDEEGEGRRAKIQRQVYMRPDYDTCLLYTSDAADD